MCCAPPPAPPAESRCHDAPQDNQCSLLPPLAKPRSQATPLCSHCGILSPLSTASPYKPAPSPVQESRCAPAMQDDATGMARTRRITTASTSPFVSPQGSGEHCKRHTAKIQQPPTVEPPSRWAHLNFLLAVLILTVLLLFLPLVLPQLPPPPVVLLLVPLAIMAASLLVLAFLPSDFRAMAASSYA